MTRLQASVDQLAEVWRHATDADDMFAAMAWVEARSLAWALADGGHPEVAVDVIRAWQRNDPEWEEHGEDWRLTLHAFESQAAA